MAKRGGTIQGKLVLKAAGNSTPFEILDSAGVSILSVDSAGNLTIAGAEVLGGVVGADITVATNKKIQFRDTGIFIQSGADGKLTISSDGSGADDITLDGSVTISGLLTLAGLLTNINLNRVGRTATADGTGTGTIAAGSGWVDVTAGGDANAIIVLPTPTPGTIVILQVGATGFELRSSDPATVAINGGTGATAESAIPANTLVVMICQSATSWKGFQLGSDGTLAKVEVAA